MSHKPISLQEFKNWLAGQKDLGDFFNINRDTMIDEENERHLGKKCKSNVSAKKLIEKIETDEDPEGIVREFLEEGGTVVSIEGKKIQIETESGSFYVPRFCVKIKKD